MTSRKPKAQATSAKAKPRREQARAKAGEKRTPAEGSPQKRRRAPERVLLRLYVTGVSHASAHAVERVRAMCEEHLHGRYELEVIDIYQLPALARGEQIVATPTLIRALPEPLRRYIGNLSNEKIIFGLDLREKR
jgi:circadian clock protein KaiB